MNVQTLGTVSGIVMGVIGIGLMLWGELRFKRDRQVLPNPDPRCVVKPELM